MTTFAVNTNLSVKSYSALTLCSRPSPGTQSTRLVVDYSIVVKAVTVLLYTVT